MEMEMKITIGNLQQLRCYNGKVTATFTSLLLLACYRVSMNVLCRRLTLYRRPTLHFVGGLLGCEDGGWEEDKKAPPGCLCKGGARKIWCEIMLITYQLFPLNLNAIKIKCSRRRAKTDVLISICGYRYGISNSA